MKRQINLLIMSLVMILNITSIYAVEDKSQYCVYKITEESIKDDKVVLDKATLDLCISQQGTSYTYEDIKIVNELPYDIQLANSSLCIPSLGEFYFASLLYNANELSNGIVYTYTDVFSFYQDTLVFHQTAIHGNVFLDALLDGLFREESQRIPNVSIDLWQGSNLIETCVSDEQGYYRFATYDKTLPYTLTVGSLNDYELTKYNESLLGNHFQLTQDHKVSLSLNENTHQNLGLQKKIYTIQYLLNDKIIQKQYHYLDKVIFFQENINKDGYLFMNWNTKKDGSGESYLKETTMFMPRENLTLYPIYKQLESKQDNIENNDIVFTNDDSKIIFFMLLLLASIAGFIVNKVLKENKNR